MADKAAEALKKYQDKMNKVEAPLPALADSHIILLGAMSSGKTVMALTASEQCPDKLPAEKVTQLDDIAYIPIEAGGLDSLKALRLQVNPKHIIPFAEILGDLKDPVEAIAMSIDIAKRLPGVDKLVGDSISKLDLLIQGWLQQPGVKDQWFGDRFAMFRMSRSQHMVAYNKFVEFPGMRIYCIHPQAATEDLNTKGEVGNATERHKREDRATGSYADADLVLGLTGGARAIWPKDVSLGIGLDKRKNASGVYERVALTEYDEKSGLAVKSRFAGILAPVETAHLGLIVRKIRGWQ